MAETLLTASEVADHLKLNVETVYALIRDEGLPAAKIGGQWRLRAEDVARWVDARIQSISQDAEP